MEQQKELTGYPSIDRPWLSRYPKELISSRWKLVSGRDISHNGYEVMYLFVIPEINQNIPKLLEILNIFIEKELPAGERPLKIFVIDKRPIRHFKTDRKYLQEQYHLT